MTVIPADEDHPDFTRPSQFTSAAILATTTTATSTPKVLGTFYTGGYESLVVRTSAQGSGVGWIYTFQWFADQALTIQLGQVNLRTLSAIPVNAQLPNRGPWCQVSVTTNSITAKSLTIAVMPRTGSPSGAGAFLDGLIHGGSNQSINGSGAAFTQNAFGLTPGEAALTIATTSASWTSQLFAFDEVSGLIGSFAGMTSAGGQCQTVRCILPVDWTQLQIINNDTGAKVFNFAVQAAV